MRWEEEEEEEDDMRWEEEEEEEEKITDEIRRRKKCTFSPAAEEWKREERRRNILLDDKGPKKGSPVPPHPLVSQKLGVQTPPPPLVPDIICEPLTKLVLKYETEETKYCLTKRGRQKRTTPFIVVKNKIYKWTRLTENS